MSKNPRLYQLNKIEYKQKEVIKMREKKEEHVHLARIISKNVNGDLERFKNKAAEFPHFTGLARLPLIFYELAHYIDKKKGDIICLQEASKPMVPELVASLKNKGLEAIDHAYNSSPGSFHYIFAYDPTVYRCISVEQLFLTVSGEPTLNSDELSKEEKFNRHFGVEFERSSPLFILEHVESGKQIGVVNNHFGLPNEHRELVAEELCKRLSHIKLPLILTGDFNQFVFGGNPRGELHMPQINKFRQHGYAWLSESLGSTELNSTFINFPYDFTRYLTKEQIAHVQGLEKEGRYEEVRDFYIRFITENNISVLGGCLDGAFVTNLDAEKLKLSKSKYCLFADNKRIKGDISEDEVQRMTVESYNKRDSNGNIKCSYASDHILLHTTVGI